ncbi:exonuclease SbcCD subunit D [Methanolobus sp.]|uniref:metallophosphoesterase family protein n=1 Tax=Methanolobus sp. TaxID=1874737 RepID=UPI0025D48CA5|nr:exonuclease SbcCD subunit D [Methanolobus sp.]
MDGTKIIHTGDTHLGYRQYHSEVRRQDFLDAFAKVIDDAISMKADAVVHAGDLFDSRNPTLDDILETMKLFSRLRDAQVPLLAVVGNHESKQSTQWLDLYENMGLVIRLGATPYRLGSVAVYGIDHVPKSRIPLFDYSVFNNEDDAEYNLLVMHQMMKPFAFGDWDVQEVLHSIPFDVHAVLLGDNHKHEIIRVGETWVTYCGSTERNGASELEPRSYNIVTAGDDGVEISKRVIPTRDFVFIPVKLSKGSQAYEEIFSAIKERDVEDKVVFVNISGDPEIKIKFSEIEEFLFSRKALVPAIRDLRTGCVSPDVFMSFSFTDPDEAVKEELGKMNLTQGGIMIDEIIRDPVLVKSRVDTEVEDKLGELLDRMDFTNKIEIPVVAALPEGESVELSQEVISHEVTKEFSLVTEYGKVEAIAADNFDQSFDQSVTAKENVFAVDEVTELTEVSESIESTEAFESTEITQVPEVSKGQAEQKHDTGIRQYIFSDDDAFSAEKAHEAADHEKEPEASSDRDHKTASKPRQYNLGDYL